MAPLPMTATPPLLLPPARLTFARTSPARQRHRRLLKASTPTAIPTPSATPTPAVRIRDRISPRSPTARPACPASAATTASGAPPATALVLLTPASRRAILRRTQRIWLQQLACSAAHTEHRRVLPRHWQLTSLLSHPFRPNTRAHPFQASHLVCLLTPTRNMT